MLRKPKLAPIARHTYRLLVVVVIAALSRPARVDAVVLCAKPRGDGTFSTTVKLREHCAARETLLNPATLGLQGPPGIGPLSQCAADAVLSGPTCMDRFEASAWHIAPASAAVIDKVRKGTVTVQDLIAAGATQVGTSSDDYGTECLDNGSACTDVYAASLPGVLPSRYMTWFQAVAICRNAGKRLPSGIEWQMAALGTPDPGLSGDGVTNCMTNAVDPPPTGTPVSTGTASTCVSDVGAFDAVGNVWEWTADLEQRTVSCHSWGSFSDDGLCLNSTLFADGASGVARGGSFHDSTSAGPYAIAANNAAGDPPYGAYDTGVRCVR